jgi:hypothetical protein
MYSGVERQRVQVGGNETAGGLPHGRRGIATHVFAIGGNASGGVRTYNYGRGRRADYVGQRSRERNKFDCLDVLGHPRLRDLFLPTSKSYSLLQWRAVWAKNHSGWGRMSTWEETLQRWAAGPSDAEKERIERTISEVTTALQSDASLRQRTIEVKVQGSYRNKTNVKRDSDVDVGVICRDSYFQFRAPGLAQSENWVAADYLYADFKNDVERALRSHFGGAAVTRGNKAFDIKAASRQVEADVAPFFEHHRYWDGGALRDGVELRPDRSPGLRVINWPEQHHANGYAKHENTGRRYRKLVRILKCLRNELIDRDAIREDVITGFLCECLMWNAPNELMGNADLTTDLRLTVGYLYDATGDDTKCDEWGEVSELKYLFKGGQKWTRQQANDFLLIVKRIVSAA